MARVADFKTDRAESHKEVLALTLEAALLARAAAGSVAANVRNGSCAKAEKELDELDKEVDEKLSYCISQASPEQVRELLACAKCVTDLERIGDLLANFCGRASIVGPRLADDDANDLTRTAVLLEKMLADFYESMATRDIERALAIFYADSQIDRLRNLIFIRHSENPEGAARKDSFNIILMAQALERAGDHAKNLAEEVIHLVTGKTARHLPQKRESYEQMYMRWLRQRDRTSA